jgi:hypothetical protein
METQQGVLSTAVSNMSLSTARNTHQPSSEVSRYFCQISTEFGVTRQIFGKVHNTKLRENLSSGGPDWYIFSQQHETIFGLHVKCYDIFCQISTEFGVTRQIFGKVHNTKLRENPSSGGPDWYIFTQEHETLFSLHVKCYDIFCQISTEFGVSRQIFWKVHNTKFHENPSSWSRTDTSGEMDRRRDMAKRIDALGDYANAPNEQAYRKVGLHVIP